MRKAVVLFLVIFLSSCFPIRVAKNISTSVSLSQKFQAVNCEEKGFNACFITEDKFAKVNASVLTIAWPKFLHADYERLLNEHLRPAGWQMDEPETGFLAGYESFYVSGLRQMGEGKSSVEEIRVFLGQNKKNGLWVFFITTWENSGDNLPKIVKYESDFLNLAGEYTLHNVAPRGPQWGVVSDNVGEIFSF